MMTVMTPTRAFLIGASLFALGACGGGETDTPAEPDAGMEPQVITADERPTVPWALSTANRHATEAGAAILAAGGSAVDAAVAVQTVLGLVEPQSSGLGGGAFMLVYDAQSGELTTYDGREVAPVSATPDMFLLEDGSRMGFYDAVTSGKSVGVPGVVGMMGLAHAEHGTLPWADLFEPAETLATDGFEVSPRLSMLLGRVTRLVDDERARALYYKEDGTPLDPGTVLQNPAYAETVRMIAEGGAQAFYSGPIAEGIVEVVNERAGAGTMTMEDLANYAPTERAPVCGAFITYRVCSMAPPSSGGVTLVQILGLTERSGALELGATPEAMALYAEASRLAFADRNYYLGDPVAMGMFGADMETLTEALMAPDYLDLRRALIGDSAAETVEPGDPLALLEGLAEDNSPDAPGTSHFSIRDSEGNIVSMTTSVETAFGSHLMSGGMILNNQLTDFSFTPEEDGKPVINAVAAGKQPRSSMTPTMVLDGNGQPVMAVGSPGGPAIIGYVAKTMLYSLAWGMDLQEAVEMPNIVVPGGSVLVETGTDDAMVAGLEAYGHEVTARDLTSGVYALRFHADGSVEMSADPRREGTAMKGN